MLELSFLMTITTQVNCGVDTILVYSCVGQYSNK